MSFPCRMPFARRWNRRRRAAASAKDATIRAEPISIFISHKTRHLYVRLATQHLFDMPITIRDPERSLGTHVFIATRTGDDGAALHWVGLAPLAAVEVKQRRHSSLEPKEEAPSSQPFPETASAALDRIALPPEALQRIERVWVGATLIISDVGMSGEGRGEPPGNGRADRAGEGAINILLGGYISNSRIKESENSSKSRFGCTTVRWGIKRALARSS